MRIKHKVWINTAADSDMTDLHYAPDEVQRLIQTDAFGQWGGGSFNIEDSDNENLDFGDVDNVKGIYFQCNGNVKLKLNGSTDEITMQKFDSVSGTVCKFFIEATLTSINVVNATGAAVAGHFHIWGIAS